MSKNFFKHLKVVTKHRFLVFKYSCKVGIPFLGLIHDLSKYSYKEFSISEKNENENYVRKQLEVDFVCNLGYERIYIQSALNIDEVAKKEQEERSLIRIDDSFRKVIVVRNNIRKWKDENGILILGLKEFLTCPDAIKS